MQRLVRGEPAPPGDVGWDPGRGWIETAALEGLDAVVHLAGEPIDARWTDDRKRRIIESRVGATALLARALSRVDRPPVVLLSASAVGVYGDRGDEELDEQSAPGSDFLARVGADWERATDVVGHAGIRVVLLRSGVVLSPRGGALAKMLLPFRLGLGGRFGSGTQWVSWITLHDWVRAAQFLLDATIGGPVNMVAPHPVRNAEFARALGQALGRPAVFPVPSVLLELLFGAEMVHSTVLASQRVHPRRLLDAGFRFDHSALAQGLEAELTSRSPAITR